LDRVLFGRRCRLGCFGPPIIEPKSVIAEPRGLAAPLWFAAPPELAAPLGLAAPLWFAAPPELPKPLWLTCEYVVGLMDAAATGHFDFGLSRTRAWTN
jgi:hypothetical protein